MKPPLFLLLLSLLLLCLLVVPSVLASSSSPFAAASEDNDDSPAMTHETDASRQQSSQIADPEGYEPPRGSSYNRGYGPEKVRNWAGYITVNPHRHLWYWFFESRNDPENEPLIIWLTGGPGCSSMIALFRENGPYKIDKYDLSLSINPDSWNNYANVIWIDQPVNTGFSYSREGDVGPLTEREISNNMYEFILKFLHEYPKYANLPFYITGESYAGHYIPSLAARILAGNEDGLNPRINFVGIAIGNGLVDPATQYQYYAKYAFEYGTISKQQFNLMETLIPGCIDLINRCSQNSTENWDHCLEAHVMCSYSEVIPFAYSGFNVYDVRHQCKHLPLCYNMKEVGQFLAQPDVQLSLGIRADSGKWEECNTFVNEELALAGDWMLNFATDIPNILKHKIRVLIYAGEYDFICNWIGNEAWVQALPWEHHDEFNRQDKIIYEVDGEEAGISQAFGGLTFLRVREAGHMVPMDQPKRSLDMLVRFISGQSFDAEKTKMPKLIEDV